MNDKARFAVIVWRTESDMLESNNHGTVYLWCEALATALHTATNLVQSGTFYHATVVRMV